MTTPNAAWKNRNRYRDYDRKQAYRKAMDVAFSYEATLTELGKRLPGVTRDDLYFYEWWAQRRHIRFRGTTITIEWRDTEPPWTTEKLVDEIIRFWEFCGCPAE